MFPGQRVQIKAGAGWPASMGSGIGIVDPFLGRPVNIGERFWVVLDPASVTNLRHDWDHPAFPAEDPEQEPDDDGCRGC